MLAHSIRKTTERILPIPIVEERTFPMVLEGSFPIASENRNTIFQEHGNDLNLLILIFYSIRLTIQGKDSGMM